MVWYIWGSQHFTNQGAWSFLFTFHPNSRRNFDFRFLHLPWAFKPHIGKYIYIYTSTWTLWVGNPQKNTSCGANQKNTTCFVEWLGQLIFFQIKHQNTFSSWFIWLKHLIWWFVLYFERLARFLFAKLGEVSWSFTRVNVGSPDPYLPKGVTTDASLCRDLTQMMLWYWWISDFDLANRTAKRAMWNKNNLSKAAIGWKFVEK